MHKRAKDLAVIIVADSILVRTGLSPNDKRYSESFEAVKVDEYEEVPKRDLEELSRTAVSPSGRPIRLDRYFASLPRTTAILELIRNSAFKLSDL